MFIRCQRLLEGPGPSDVIVAFQTADGRTEEVVVNIGSLNGDHLNIAVIAEGRDGRALIELPREATSGQSRVWVMDTELQELQAAE